VAIYSNILANLSANGTNIDCGGRKSTYQWCEYTKQVPLPLYIFAYTIVLGVAYPAITIPLGTLFSHILGPRQQVLSKKLHKI
jgi:hypothetical protein